MGRGRPARPLAISDHEFQKRTIRHRQYLTARRGLVDPSQSRFNSTYWSAARDDENAAFGMACCDVAQRRKDTFCHLFIGFAAVRRGAFTAQPPSERPTELLIDLRSRETLPQAEVHFTQPWIYGDLDVMPLSEDQRCLMCADCVAAVHGVNRVDLRRQLSGLPSSRLVERRPCMALP